MYFGMIKPLPTRNLINISAAALILLGGFFAFPSFTSAELSLPVTPCDDEQVDAILPTYNVSAHLVPGMIKEPGNVAFQYGADNNSFVSKSGDIITFNVNLLFTPDNPLAIIKLMAFDASCNIIFGFGPAFLELSPNREKVVTFDTSTNFVSHDGNAHQQFPNFAPRYVWVEVVDQYPNANLKTYSYLIDILDPQNPTGQPDAEPPQPPARNPVIIIPGILGSQLFHGDEEIWIHRTKILLPGDQFLDALMMDENGVSLENITVGDILRKPLPIFDYSVGLIEVLENAGYEENIDLFVFPYDWREDVTVSEDKLKDKIDLVKNTTGFEKVDIIAHSMGGLVVKAYISEHDESSINKLIFVGTPHLGSPEAAVALLFGKQTPKFFASTAEMKKIARNMPSIYELLPSRNYFNFSGYLKKDGRLLNFDETAQELLSLGMNVGLLNLGDDFHSNGIDGMSFQTPYVFNINGCNTPTLGAFKAEHNDLRLPRSIQILQGDGTVPLRSSNVSVIPQNSYYVDDITHDTMLTNESIRSLIAALLTDNVFDDDKITKDSTECKLKRGKILAIYSPVQMDVTDVHGNHS